MKLNSFFGGCLTMAIVIAGAASIFRGCHNSQVVDTKETTKISRDTIPVFIDTPYRGTA